MPEAVDLAQPARQRVPTRENLGHIPLNQALAKNAVSHAENNRRVVRRSQNPTLLHATLKICAVTS